MRGKTIAKFVVTVLIVVSGFAYFKDDIAQLYGNFDVKLAKYPTTKNTVRLGQNIDDPTASWFYHADQGTRTFGIPYEWFVELEQPSLWSIFFPVGRFSDPAYLDGYGFIQDPVTKPDPATGKVLPIGFAHGGPMLDPSGQPWREPRYKKDMTGIGLTCAGCHTGRFTYNDTTVIVDGGPALTDLFKLKQGLGVALLQTRLLPGRFSRFAERILKGSDSTVEQREELKAQIDLVLKQLKNVKDLEDSVASRSIVEGYGRLDALNRIGNQVFSLDLNNPGNYAGSSAPVHYPRIWNTPWFDWVQYNGSIMQPMVRNAGESLGVSAELNLTDPASGLFKSSVRIDTLHEMELMIKCNAPPKATECDKLPSAENGFPGLQSPKWPDFLPPIKPDLAEKGAALYKAHCQDCHQPPVSDRAAFFDFNDKKRWGTNEIGQPILKLENIKISHIGTDPAQAADMRNRTVATPANLGIDQTSFALALGALVEKTVNYIYDQADPPLTAKQRQDLNGNMPDMLRKDLAYKVRPLNGIWATPPYLHNGSVPTIWALLSPIEERRETKFYPGNREYDPEKLGYKTGEFTNGVEFDTSIRGNSNEGHQFSKEYVKGKPVQDIGIIGPLLEPGDRRALIEFLKTQ